MTSITLTPIGIVRGGRTEMAEDHWGGEVATLVLDPGMLDPDATAGLAEFSHLEVVFHFHLEHRVRRGATHPRGNPAWPRVGVLAGHSPVRPNHLGFSRCQLLQVAASRLLPSVTASAARAIEIGYDDEQEQRRARRIAMRQAELSAFHGGQRTCRVAVASRDGPHLTPLRYGCDETALLLYSVVRSQRWTDISRDGRVAVLVDVGDTYGELRGLNCAARPRLSARCRGPGRWMPGGRAGAALRPQVRRHRRDGPHRSSRLAAAGP
jgi:tRNA (Thr-GGU) A37 N-methylase